MKINISIDDVSPHPLSSVKVLDRCFDLIEEFPDIKFTLFVPTAYWRTIKPPTQTKCPLFLSDYPVFCKTISSLPTNSFEIGYHGYYHGIPGVSDNDEFQSLSFDDAKTKFFLMKQEVAKSCLEAVFKPIFRPPAWRLSASGFKALEECGIRTFALSPKDYLKPIYQGEDKARSNVVYYDSAPPFDPLHAKESLEVVYHACEWDKNYLNKEMFNDLKKWIHGLKTQIDFVFIENLLYTQ